MLTFDDEFSSGNLNSTGGTLQTGYYFGRTFGTEQEYFSPDSVSVNNGVLTLEAAPSSGNPGGMPYTSGMVTTEGVFAQQYGYFEMRAELPAGQGLMPGFWMLPTDHTWPPELDIQEALGQDPTHYSGNTHNGPTGTDQFTTRHDFTNLPDLTTGFHTYGVDWEPDKITWYFDGQAMASSPTPSDMNKPMYLIANLSVVGQDGFGGPPDPTTHFPADLNIDYFRAYSSNPNVTAVTPQAGYDGSGATPWPTPAQAAPHEARDFMAADHGDVITDFQLGQDDLDLTGLMKSIIYHGQDPVADRVMQSGSSTSVAVDPHGHGGAGEHTVVPGLENVLPSALKAGHDFIWHA